MGGVQARPGSQVAVDLVMRARACEGRECVREDGCCRQRLLRDREHHQSSSIHHSSLTSPLPGTLGPHAQDHH